LKLQVTCLGENSPNWFTGIQNLALSVRRFEGPLGEARMIAHFIGDADPRFVEELARLDVVTRVVEPMSGGGPANKLRMFEPEPADEFDLLVALDCDVVVSRDFGSLLDDAAIGVKTVDFDRLKQRDWRKLCAAADLDGRPENELYATTTGRTTPPYFNSGVITVPRELCRPLGAAWMQSYKWLRARLAEDPHLLPRHLHWFGEQISLALAIRAGDLPWRELPAGMNFPTHVGNRAGESPEGTAPYVLHYHGEIDAEGFLIPPSPGPARVQIEEFNRERAAYLGLAQPPPAPPVLSHRLSRMQQTLPRSLRRRGHRLETWVHDLVGGRSREPKPLRPARR
jgi:hypothetical protein